MPPSSAIARRSYDSGYTSYWLFDEKKTGQTYVWDTPEYWNEAGKRDAENLVPTQTSSTLEFERNGIKYSVGDGLPPKPILSTPNPPGPPSPYRPPPVYSPPINTGGKVRVAPPAWPPVQTSPPRYQPPPYQPPYNTGGPFWDPYGYGNRPPVPPWQYGGNEGFVIYGPWGRFEINDLSKL